MKYESFHTVDGCKVKMCNWNLRYKPAPVPQLGWYMMRLCFLLGQRFSMAQALTLSMSAEDVETVFKWCSASVQMCKRNYVK